jgi:hypothetical protein
MPAHRKPPGTHQGHRPHTPAVVLAASGSEAPPDPPAGLLAATQEAWSGFWSSPLASLVIPADLPGLRRLFQLHDERERAWRSYRRRRLVEGSQGQPVANPLFRVALGLEAEIRALEDRYGLSPSARLRLGIRFGKAARTLEDLARDLEQEPSDLDQIRQRFEERRRQRLANPETWADPDPPRGPSA